jgi:hypothetical protein
MANNRTGDLRLDTSDLTITVTGNVTETGKVYFEATDQNGNTERSRDPKTAEMMVRAKVDVERGWGWS